MKEANDLFNNKKYKILFVCLEIFAAHHRQRQ